MLRDLNKFENTNELSMTWLTKLVKGMINIKDNKILLKLSALIINSKIYIYIYKFSKSINSQRNSEIRLILST